MSDASIDILLDDERPAFAPGDQIAGSVALDAELASQISALETSIIWRTEGKGDEDFGVWFFDRFSPHESATGVLRRFSATLPPSPLSYEGFLVKIRWCVRVRAFRDQGKPLQVERPIVLGGRRARFVAQPNSEDQAEAEGEEE